MIYICRNRHYILIFIKFVPLSLFSFVSYQTGAVIIIRGKGGKTPGSNPTDNEPMHAYITANNNDPVTVQKAVEKVSSHFTQYEYVK